MSSSLKILFVEDSEDLLKVWIALFKTAPEFSVRAVSRGSTAVEMVESGFRPDILITDFYLGDCTGIELIQKVKAIIPGIRIIMITGNHEDETLRKMSANGEIDLLIKPVKFKALKEVLHKGKMIQKHEGWDGSILKNAGHVEYRIP